MGDSKKNGEERRLLIIVYLLGYYCRNYTFAFRITCTERGLAGDLQVIAFILKIDED